MGNSNQTIQTNWFELLAGLNYLFIFQGFKFNQP